MPLSLFDAGLCKRQSAVLVENGLIAALRYRWHERNLHKTRIGLPLAVLDLGLLLVVWVAGGIVIRDWYFGYLSVHGLSNELLVGLLVAFNFLLAVTAVLVGTCGLREIPVIVPWILNAVARLLLRRPAFNVIPLYAEPLHRYVQRECIECGYPLIGAIKKAPRQLIIICPECGSKSNRATKDDRLVLAARKSPRGTPLHGLRWRMLGLLTVFGGQLLIAVVLHIAAGVDELGTLEWLLFGAIAIVLSAIVLIDLAIKRSESSERLDPAQQWLLDSARCPRCAADLLCGDETDKGLRKCPGCGSQWELRHGSIPSGAANGDLNNG